jgi:hypothetical protein
MLVTEKFLDRLLSELNCVAYGSLFTDSVLNEEGRRRIQYGVAAEPNCVIDIISVKPP